MTTPYTPWYKNWRIVAIVLALAAACLYWVDTTYKTPEEREAIAESAAESAYIASVPEQERALADAYDLLSFYHFSKTRLYNQLIEGFYDFDAYSPAAAQYAVDNIHMDWKDSALAKAEYLAHKSTLSKQKIYHHLTSPGLQHYSTEEAQYAIDNLQINWQQQALLKAEEILREEMLSKQAISYRLTEEQFTPEEVQYAITNLQADWQDVALEHAKRLAYSENFSQQKIYKQLIEKGHNEADVQYAMANFSVDWRYNALRTARQYAVTKHLSKQGLFNTLVSAGEQFTAEEAQFAIDNLQVDYKINALRTAQMIIPDRVASTLSKQEIYDYLTSSIALFTPEEANHAIQYLKE